MNGLRVAIVHERFTELGGSERVVEQLHAMWPDAEVHAPLVDEATLPTGLRDVDIRSSPLNRLHRPGHGHAPLLPLLPLAMSRLDIGDVDLVITSHHAFANRVRPPPGVPVVAYVHTPARWMWEPEMRAGEAGGLAGRALLGAFARSQRRPDRRAANRAQRLVANSSHVAGRIERHWGRRSVVVAPPVDVSYHTPDPGVQRQDFFLLAGRLVPYKRPELAVQAAQLAGVRLVVAGDGRSRRLVESLAGPRVEVLGAVDDVELRDLYRRCRALVFPGEEDFGIVPVEAQACGAPVLARRVGGVLDSVVDGETGRLYVADRDEVGSLAQAMRTFPVDGFDPVRIRSHAESFGPAAFATAFGGVVTEALTPRG